MQSLSQLHFSPGTLMEQVRHQTRHALEVGALRSIDTQIIYLEVEGLTFVVRMLENLKRKEQAKANQKQLQKTGKDLNPFLPCEPDLFVTNLTDTHFCLLNKYNVVDNHMLMVTRSFEEQDSWLNLADFHALALGMAEVDGLAFYNGGTLAGSSQRHKHLQLVPLPLDPECVELPVDRLLESHPSQPSETVKQLPQLPFVHAVMEFSGRVWENAARAAEILLQGYQDLLQRVDIDITTAVPQTPYNLLLTRDWMLVVPRQQEHYQGIPVNSLGFAGSLLVKNPEQLALLQTVGPLDVLKQVAVNPNRC